MGKNSKRKKLRGSRGSRKRGRTHSTGATSEYANVRGDLFVPIPSKSNNSSRVEQQLLIQAFIERLSSIGHTHMALTHVIYGRPNKERDSVDVAIPKSLYEFSSARTTSDERKSKKQKKKELKPNATASADNQSQSQNKNNITILRRLHSIVETVSDVASFHNLNNDDNNNDTSSLLKEYDIVSVCPMNDATFQATCQYGKAIDIITIDYTKQRGLKLPYNIKSSQHDQSIQTFLKRGGTFEICLSSAILNIKHRKSLIHASREVVSALQQQNRGNKNSMRILLSSGDRTIVEDNNMGDNPDAGVLALRTIHDLHNLGKTILSIPPNIASECMTKTAGYVLQHALGKRQGQVPSIVEKVQVMDRDQLLMENFGNDNIDQEEDHDDHRPELSMSASKVALESVVKEEENDDDNDGFIAM